MTTRRALACVQYLLLLFGFSALGYCAIVVFEAACYQAGAREHSSQGNVGLIEASTTRSFLTTAQQSLLRSGSDPALVGRIEIPSVHISAMVAEGISPRVLRLAVGHIPGTALPGEPGNVVLAAHRDTFFRRLGELKSGDVIQLSVPGRQFVYSVRFADIVGPNETWVLEFSPGQSLTLITCYPFYFVGPAPKRFVIRARRIDTE
jgi:sortase A